MKKKVIMVLGIVLIILLAILLIFTIYKNTKSYDGEIVGIEYSYGGLSGKYKEYKIYIENGKTYIVGKGLSGEKFNINKQVRASVLEDISEIIEDNEIYKWYGFDESAEGVLDGYSFTLTVKYRDGREERAHGYVKKPDNYKEGHEALSEYLERFK